MTVKSQNQYVLLDRAEELLAELLAPGPLIDIVKAMRINSKTSSEIFEELEFLFEDIEKALKDRLETSLARFEALTIFLGINEPPKEISNASILKAKRAVLQFSKTIGVDQEAIDALERVFSQANSDIIVAKASASIRDLAQALEEVIEAVKNSLKEWKEQRKDILTELLEDGSEETQMMIKTGLSKGVNTLLERLALDGIIDPQFTNIEALPGDTKRFVLAEIIR